MHGLTITFNGEIYNFVELREDLEKLGYSFETSSDTEVILNSYREWGTKCFSRFNGDWALCLFDNKTGTLIVSRDRFGIKPLYFLEEADKLVFSSDITSILQVTEATYSQSELNQFQKHGEQYWRENTVFEGIKRFPAGHFASLDCREFNPTLRLSEYYDLETAASALRLDDLTIDEIAVDYRRLL